LDLPNKREEEDEIDHVRIPQNWLSALSDTQLKNIGRKYIRDTGRDLPSP